MKLTISDKFTYFPHFKDTSLFKRYGGVFSLEPTRVNVLVGPNGSGKSTLLDILSLLTLSIDFEQSRASKEYLKDELWTNEDKWGSWAEERYLIGATLSEGFCPALSFKPHRIPGNERCVTTAMMVGYFEEAREYAAKTENKSTGQSVSAQLSTIRAFLQSQGELEVRNKEAFGLPVSEKKRLVDSHYSRGCYNSRKFLLTQRIRWATGHRLVIMDEPEQSLDMRANLQLWGELANLKLKNTTVIVASHSPFALNKAFNVLEGEKGYANEIRTLMANR